MYPQAWCFDFHFVTPYAVGVLREQRSLVLTWHPDVSVHNTFAPSFIFQASVSAGAAAAGEALKDKHHENIVAAGGLLYPLIVETFGIWIPFAVDTLKNIAAATTTKNGLTSKEAFRSFIQLLLVCLWTYNAKTILHYGPSSSGGGIR